ncbi:hypothetical protein [Luteibaculum oceani]|uniref:DUF3575 domain-containing protein n=1 Tax=Luteibaculum oceani TaxID=1294296 RepID=A0A5C6US20_9FLAO|nr:hypothetical protein [Luteibaculum oceani]TXC76123.1 hypothetical protein FRX97_11465 [Luteibaculum oceani]
MKTPTLFIILALLLCKITHAQSDTIYFADDNISICVVEKMNSDEVVYSKPTLSPDVKFNVSKSKIRMIKFHDGEVWINYQLGNSNENLKFRYPDRKYAIKLFPATGFLNYGELGFEMATDKISSIDFNLFFNLQNSESFHLGAFGYKFRLYNKYQRDYLACGPYVKPTAIFYKHTLKFENGKEHKYFGVGPMLNFGYQWVVLGRGFIELNLGSGLSYSSTNFGDRLSENDRETLQNPNIKNYKNPDEQRMFFFEQLDDKIENWSNIYHGSIRVGIVF